MRFLFKPRLKPKPKPRTAVTARVSRSLSKLAKDNVVPSDKLRADYAWYLDVKSRRPNV